MAKTLAKQGSREARLLRTSAAAKYLGLGPWTVRNLIHVGELPVVQLGEGKPFLLDIRDLDAWIEKSKHFRSQF